MRVEVGGRRYAHFLHVAVEATIDSLSRRFEFKAATRGIGDIPFRPGQACRIWVGEDPVCTGWIEKIEMNLGESAEDVTYTVSGRDKLCDLLDSSIDGLGDFRSTVASVARSAIRFLGIDAEVRDLSTSGARSLAGGGDILAPDPTEKAAEFLWGLAGRRQVLLSSDGDGNLLILNGNPVPIAAKIVHRVDGIENNLVAMSFSSDHSRRFGIYRVVTQKNLAESAFSGIDVEPEEAATVVSEHRDARIRASRRQSLAGDAHYASGDAKARARWEANLARTDGLVYTASLPSHRDANGDLWALNTAPVVDDEFVGISSRMMISGILWEDREEGEATTLTLRRLDAYAAQAGLTDIERRARAAAGADDGDDLDDLLEGLELE